MTIIFKSKNYDVTIPSCPHVDRADGGHIMIIPHEKVTDRTELTINQAIELMLLTIVFGDAMKQALNQNGIDVVRINYQENGNWAFQTNDEPFLHVHLYGRAKSAVKQKHGSALSFPDPNTDFYDSFEGLTLNDIELVIEIARNLIRQKHYEQYIPLS